MIDSHCHLDHEPLINNINEVLYRSKNVGIKKILTICTTLSSFESIKKILILDDIIYGTFGIHPHETDNNHVSKKIILDNIKISAKIIGIGETGLDFYYNNNYVTACSYCKGRGYGKGEVDAAIQTPKALPLFT